VLQLTPESSPEVQALLARARDRDRGGLSRSELRAERIVGCIFLAAAIAIAFAFDTDRSFSVAEAAMVFLVLAVASRVVFEVGSVHTAPLEIAFVPALFVLPPEFAPLIVAGALAAGSLVTGGWRGVPLARMPSRFLTACADACFSLGPALVLIAAGGPDASDVAIVTLLIALASQFAGESLASRLREWQGHGASLREQVLESAWIYSVDAMLAPVGFALALAAEARQGTVLLALPLIGALHFLARDRTRRISSVMELSEAYRGTAHLLSNVIGHDDEYTGVHTRQVAGMAAQVATRLRLTPSQQRKVEFGAMLHDVGKIAISKAIINKPASLDRHEWEVMETHTVEGQRMLDQIGGLMSEIGTVVRWSHERFDGEGYPDGIAGSQIPIESRIVFCCDAFNAMTTDRPYRKAMSEQAAIAELRANAGTQFDPDVVETLLACLRDEEQKRPDNGAPEPLGLSEVSTNADG
jgi:HD-GYP domain-containing protein (c-di-GMP phosphodiesterase class II)